jgi:hypothetical protein
MNHSIYVGEINPYELGVNWMTQASSDNWKYSLNFVREEESMNRQVNPTRGYETGQASFSIGNLQYGGCLVGNHILY